MECVPDGAFSKGENGFHWFRMLEHIRQREGILRTIPGKNSDVWLAFYHTGIRSGKQRAGRGRGRARPVAVRGRVRRGCAEFGGVARAVRNGGRARVGSPHGRPSRRIVPWSCVMACVMRVGKWRREPGGPAANHRAGCAALPRTVPRTEPRHAKLSASATFHAAHRAVARRRDGDIVPYRNGARGWSTAAGHESGARARDTSVEYGEGHE